MKGVNGPLPEPLPSSLRAYQDGETERGVRREASPSSCLHSDPHLLGHTTNPCLFCLCSCVTPSSPHLCTVEEEYALPFLPRLLQGKQNVSNPIKALCTPSIPII